MLNGNVGNKNVRNGCAKELFTISNSTTVHHSTGLLNSKPSHRLSPAFSATRPVTNRAHIAAKSSARRSLGPAIALFRNMFRFFNLRRQSGESIMKQWWCASCLEQISLDSHGRCSTCGSDAVGRIANLEVSNRRPQGLQALPRVHTDQ